MKQATWKTKVVWISLAAMLASSAFGMGAGAAPDQSGKTKGKSEAQVEVKVVVDADADTEVEADADLVEEANEEVNAEADAETEANAEVDADADVDVEVEAGADDSENASDTKKSNGNTEGLLKAIKNLQDKPALDKVKALLEIRGVTAEELALTLEEQGDLEAAVVAQEEAVIAAPTDVDAVKKLAKLLNKAIKKEIRAFVNGKQPNFDVKPFIKDGRTLVPFRAIAASLNAEVSFDAETKTVTVVRGDVTVSLTLGSNIALVNGEEVELDVAAQAVQGRTVIPLRFLSEALGATVTFDQETQSIIVTETAEETDAAENTETGEGTEAAETAQTEETTETTTTEN